MKYIILIILLTLGVWAQEMNDKQQDSLKITRLAMMEKNHQLVAGDNNGIIHFLTPDPLEETRSFKAHDSEITQIVFPENEQFFFTTAKDKTIKQWDTKTLKLVHTYKGHESIVSHIDVTPDGKVLASLDMNFSVALWGTRSYRLENKIDIYSHNEECYYESFPVPCTGNHTILDWMYYDYFDIKISSNAKKIIATDGRLYIFDVEHMKILNKYYPHKHHHFSNIVYSKNSENMYATDNKSIFVINGNNQNSIDINLSVQNITIDASNTKIVGFSYDHPNKMKLKRFDIERNMLLPDISFSQDEINSNPLLHNNQIIFARSNLVEFISFETGTPLKSILINATPQNYHK